MGTSDVSGVEEFRRSDRFAPEGATPTPHGSTRHVYIHCRTTRKKKKTVQRAVTFSAVFHGERKLFRSCSQFFIELHEKTRARHLQHVGDDRVRRQAPDKVVDSPPVEPRRLAHVHALEEALLGRERAAHNAFQQD